MEKVVEIIKKKEIDKSIQDAVNKSCALFGGNIPQDEVDEAVKDIICLEIIRNNDLADAVLDKAVDDIVSELSITCQPSEYEGKEDDQEKNLIEQIGNVRQGLVALLKFLS